MTQVFYIVRDIAPESAALNLAATTYTAQVALLPTPPVFWRVTATT